MNRATLIGALPPAAQAMCQNRYIDPADAFIAFSMGQTPTQARSRARNSARSLGQSWPARVPVLDLDDLHQIQHSCGLHAPDALATLEASEAASEALAAPSAAQRLRLADLEDADTAGMAAAFGVTQRRAQQIKKAALEASADQLELFVGEVDGESKQ